jgi:hypothetical protein
VASYVKEHVDLSERALLMSLGSFCRAGEGTQASPKGPSSNSLLYTLAGVNHADFGPEIA